MTLRPPTLDDLPALVEFFGSLEGLGSGASEAELRGWLSMEKLDPEANFRALFDGDRVVGWCDVWDRNDEHARFFMDARARVGVDRVYPTLFDWGLARVGELAVKDAVIRASGSSGDEAFLREVGVRGFRLVRHFFHMEIDLTEQPPEPRWPDGIAVRTFREGDEQALYEANGDAFADHWDFVPLPFEDWLDFTLIRSDVFDPTLWFLAQDGSEIAGLCLCRAERRPGVGYVHILGVRPQWRRRGLGRALLLHAFRELRGRGRARADLGVDAENTTGAVRLYERVGMEVAHRMDSYELVP